MKKFSLMVAALTVSIGISVGGNGLLGMERESVRKIDDARSYGRSVADSIGDIITEMKNGDLSRTIRLAEAYRYGFGVDKNMLNAMICYQMAEVDFDSEARKSYEEKPNDEFGCLIELMNMYDRNYIEDAEELLSSIPKPAPAWVTMMRKVIDYKGGDINGYILSLIGPESTSEESFLAFGCCLSNNKESNDFTPLNDLLKVLSDKVPYFYNRTGAMKLEEYKVNPDVRLLKETVAEFKKAHDAGFLTPRHARRIFEEDIRSNVDLSSVFTSHELRQLQSLGVSTSSEMDHVEVVEMTPEDEVVELIESMTIEEVFNMTATFNGFMEAKNVYECFNFPKEIGKPMMIAHPNAKHRDSIIGLLELIPEDSIVYDETDDHGRFDRLFIDDSNNELLYVHAGINGNDTVLILFKGGARQDIDKFIDELNAQGK